MAKRKVFEKVETGVIVTVISVLVWLYAEGENVLTFNNQRMQVQFVAPPGQDLAVVPQGPVPILVSVRASAGEIDQFEEMIRKGPIRIEVEVDPEADSPTQTLVLKEALLASKVGSLGVNILQTDPATRTVHAEPLVTRKLPVVSGPTDVQFAEPPAFVPREVAVTLPRSLARASKDNRVIARVDALNLSSYDVNTDTVATVPLEAPQAMQGPWTTLAQPTAQMTFNIRKLTDTYRIPTVQLRINTDPLTLKDFEIGIAQSDMLLRDVRVTGPSDVVAAIRAGDARVWAELRPTRDQAERGVEALTPVIVAPEGVTFAPPAPVPVTIRRK